MSIVISGYRQFSRQTNNVVFSRKFRAIFRAGVEFVLNRARCTCAMLRFRSLWVKLKGLNACRKFAIVISRTRTDLTIETITHINNKEPLITTPCLMFF